MEKGHRRGAWRWTFAAMAALWCACHEPDRVRAVDASAAFDTDSLDFGEVPVGEWRELTVGVRNVGYVPFDARDVQRLQENPSFTAELQQDTKVMPGEVRPIRVRFHPL